LGGCAFDSFSAIIYKWCKGGDVRHTSID
jgi:hypothetical protein